jgi:hypothetical protein
MLVAKIINKGQISICSKIISNFSTSPFSALSPLDGRYANSTGNLHQYFSEGALMKYRVKVESEWMLHLMKNSVIPIEKECSLEQVER